MNHKRDKNRVTALPNSPTLLQLWDALGSKLIEAKQGDLLIKQAPGCVRTARGKAWKDYIRDLRACMATLKTPEGPATIGRVAYSHKFWKT